MFKELLCRLHALALYYKTAHWQTKGSLFYQDHLLFERLYNSAFDKIDEVAEKSIGVTGDLKNVNLPDHLNLLKQKLDSLPYESEAKDVLQAALMMEIELTKMLTMEDKKPNTLGSKNLLQALADEAEGRVYLIKQRLK